jgi:hypothetical protein
VRGFLVLRAPFLLFSAIATAALLLGVTLRPSGSLPVAHASFHIAHIDELMSGAGGSSAIQYVEIQQDFDFQNLVAGAKLTVFHPVAAPDVLIASLGHNVTSGAGRRFIMASDNAPTLTFLAASGITPDFTFPASPGIPADTGMVCWGKPLDPVVPAQYVDCVAYGNYSSTLWPAPTFVPNTVIPTNLPAGDGTLSLTFVSVPPTNHNDLADYALRCPTPQNDANGVGNFGPCSTATLTVSKQVTNDNGGTKMPADFSLHLKKSGTDVAGSPHAGSAGGVSYTLVPGTYTLSEDPMALYAGTFSGNCGAGGSITLAASDVRTCTITNNDTPPSVGGIAEQPGLLPAGATRGSADDGGDSVRVVYGGAAGIAAAAIVGAAGWYVYRRRRLR